MSQSDQYGSIDAKYREALSIRDQQAHVPENKVSTLSRLPTFSGFVDLRPATGAAVSMFLCEGDDLVATRCFWRKEYEPLSTRLWALLCKSAAGVADIGAHTGYYSLIAKATRPEMTVYSIEPNPDVFARIVLNIRANGWDPKHCLNAAVTDHEDSPVRLVINSPQWYMSTSGSIVGEMTESSRVIQANPLSMTRLLAQDVTLLKIDVEGIEETLLAAASQVGFGAVQDILVECLKPLPASVAAHLHRHNWVGRQIIDQPMAFGEETQAIGYGDPNKGYNWWLSRRSAADRENIIKTVLTTD